MWSKQLKGDRDESKKMQLSTEFIFRLIGAISLSVGGGFLGNDLADTLSITPEVTIAVFTLVGFLIGLVLTPYFTILPLRRISHKLASMPPERLIAIISGIFLGLMAAALLSLPGSVQRVLRK